MSKNVNFAYEPSGVGCFLFMIAIWFTLVIFGGYGWINNIIHIIQHANDGLDVIEVLRFVGIFVAPLGVVLGYLV